MKNGYHLCVDKVTHQINSFDMISNIDVNDSFLLTICKGHHVVAGKALLKQAWILNEQSLCVQIL